MKRLVFIILTLLCVSGILANGAKYLIIAPDSFVQALQPLADWKTRKGVLAKIVPLSVTGNTAAQIKSYIVNAYHNWEIRPEYILLAGFGTVLPTSGVSDDYYADITGNYQIELSIGRLPCTTVNKCNMLVAKILGYERTPYLIDSLWFRKGTTIVLEDNPPDAYYQADCRYIRNLMLSHGFIQTDSFISIAGNTSTDVMNAINDGRTYVVFRGSCVVNWWSPFDQVNPSYLTNGFKLPVVISGSCATVSLTTIGYQADRFLLAGTAQNPKGAIAYFGTTVSAHNISLPRGLVARGFFDALFTENKFKLGDATKRAKFILDSILHVQTRYNEWNLLGDPELNLWSMKPKQLTVVHDTTLNTLPQIFTVNVRQAGLPVSNALVCIMQDTTIYQYSNTNSSGNVSFNIFPHSAGTMSITVTAQNCIPYERNITIRPTNLAHDIGILSIIEPIGTIISGVIIPKVIVKNFGNNTDTFPVTFSIDDIYYQTVSSVALNPGDTTTISFLSWLATLGVHTIRAFTALANDEWRGNDTVTETINVIAHNFVAEGFNDSTFPPTGWQNVIVQGTHNWQRVITGTNPNCTPYEGNGMITYPNWSATLGNSARLISPPSVLGNSPTTCSLKFFMYHDPAYPGGQYGPDSVKIEYSNDDTNFHRIAAFRRYEPTEGWVEHTVALGSLTGTVYIGILGYSQYGNNSYLDYIRMYATSNINEDNSANNRPNFIITTLYSPQPNPASNGPVSLTFALAEPSINSTAG